MTQDPFRLAKRMRLSLDNHGGAVASDVELLHRFLVNRQDEAFSQLVERHGPMVWGLCQRLLPHHADAEDAFQATFLTFYQHAGRIRLQASLASWLYGVACRIAYKSKRTRVRAQQRELRLARPVAQAEDNSWDQAIRDIIDAELARLPAHYREPLLLCYLQGQSHALAAQTLGWPIGTVAGRLSRAKELLRSRLIRRGVAPSVAAAMSFDLAQAYLPGELLAKTLRTIHLGGTSAVSLLAKGAVTSMLLTKWLTAGAIGITLTFGAGWYFSAFAKQGEGKKEAVDQSQQAPVKPTELSDYQLIQGQWRCETKHEVTGTLQSVEQLTFRGRKYARSTYKVVNGIVGERNYESDALEYVLGPNQSPNRMELQEVDSKGTRRVADPAEKGIERSLCMYQLNGDLLTIHFGGHVPYQVNQQGKVIPDRNSPQATFPTPGDLNVRTLIYRRQTTDIQREALEDRIEKMLRKDEIAQAFTLPDTPIRRSIRQGESLDIMATNKVADQNGTIKSIYILEDIEVLAVYHALNKEGFESDATRVILRLTRPQALTLKFHQDHSRLNVEKHQKESVTKVTPIGIDANNRSKAISDTERQLLEEQVKANEEVFNLRFNAYKTGKDSIHFLLEAIKHRAEAKLDLAGNNSNEVRSALKEAHDSSKDAESIANAKYQAGSGLLLEVTLAKVERLNYELQLLRLEKSAK